MMNNDKSTLREKHSALCARLKATTDGIVSSSRNNFPPPPPTRTPDLIASDGYLFLERLLRPRKGTAEEDEDKLSELFTYCV